MLNPFPELLFFSILAPTLLRIAAALVLIYASSMLWKCMKENEGGSKVASLFLASTALGLAGLIGFGIQTQIASILLGTFTLAELALSSKYPNLAPLPKSSYVLLLAIAGALLVSGAGAFAFDIAL